MPSPPPVTPFRIETERLLIRPWEPGDEPAFRALVRDPEMMRYISSGQPWDEEQIAEFFTRQRRQLEARGICLGALVERATGQGIGTEAGKACLRYAWDDLGLDRVVAMAQQGNGPSIRIMEKIGMHFEQNVLSRDIGFPGGDIELVIYAIER